MRRLLFAAVTCLALAGPAAAQIIATPSSDPRVQAEQGRAAAAARADMAARMSRNTALTQRNLAADRQGVVAGERETARATLARERAEADQTAAAAEAQRLQQERLRLERLDPLAAPRL